MKSENVMEKGTALSIPSRLEARKLLPLIWVQIAFI